MAQKYTEEQKAAVLARVPEIGVRAAAEEAGIPWQAVSKWNKAAKTEEAQALYSKAEESASDVITEAFAEADAKLAEAEDAAKAIVDKAEAESKAAKAEAKAEKKEEIKDKVDATKIEAKQKARGTARKTKEKADQVKGDVKVAAKEKADATKIETKKKTSSVSRKVKEKKENVKAKVEKPVKKARAAKMDLVFETQGGLQIKPEEIAAKIPKGADTAYIKLEENKIYWVKGTENGSVDIW